MFGSWFPHRDYVKKLLLNLHFHCCFDRNRVFQMEKSIMKLIHLDLDKSLSILRPLYSNTGTPSREQAGIIRSLVLMLDQGYCSIPKWAEKVANDRLLYDICGFHSKAPSASSYYDFIDRLWNGSKEPEIRRKKKIRACRLKPRQKYKKGKKLPPKHKGITKRLVEKTLSGRPRSSRREEILQEFFSRLIVDTSAQLGLIGNSQALSIAGDGSPYYSGSSHYGVKVCDCKSKGIYNCKCHRRYSDPDATWGWDSYRECYFYGDTLYMFTATEAKYDLPVYIRIVQAKRHDSSTTIFAMNEFRQLFPQFTVKDVLFDGAMDNLPTYQLCRHWGIRPFIPLDDNSKLTEDNLPQGVVGFDNKGRPLCLVCIPYVNWGNCGDKGTKYRCWFAVNGKQAPCCCTGSHYGKTVYIKSDDNPRLFTPVPRGTDAFKEKLKQRSGAERSNKRVFEDYKVEGGKMRSSRQRYFRAVLAAINIHLDAWYWHIDVSLAELLESTMQQCA